MGLLDDAIREHLELKRRRGADPGEVAHQEHAALAPVFADEPHGDDGYAGPPEDGQPLLQDPHEGAEWAAGDAAHLAADPEQPAAHAEHLAGDPEHDPRLADLSAGGQETAELDMASVLAEDDSGQMEHDHPIASHDTQAHDGVEAREDELLEWETPDRAEAGHVPEQVPGQERLSFE